ncbi:MAG: ABC transporter ATP-binding protein [Betaproteobacteria bacterium]|nr:MAG: ABC transporter ATP-binding protein [Betaproteobacteria bacterium]
MLQLRNLNKSFGSLKVVDAFSLDLAEGESLGIIGPNGAGKTTLFSLIDGQLAPDAGSVHFLGADVTRQPPQRRCRAGMGRTFQVPRPFHGMTVFESARVAACFGGGAAGRRADALALEAIACCGLLDRVNTPCAELTLLDRKRMELTRALATDPRLLLLDEIGGGLTDPELSELDAILRDIRARGVAIVWIEHIVHALTAFVDRLVVINFGAPIADGAPKEVMALPQVHEIYLGLDVDEAA